MVVVHSWSVHVVQLQRWRQDDIAMLSLLCAAECYTEAQATQPHTQRCYCGPGRVYGEERVEGVRTSKH